MMDIKDIIDNHLLPKDKYFTCCECGIQYGDEELSQYEGDYMCIDCFSHYFFCQYCYNQTTSINQNELGDFVCDDCFDKVNTDD